MSWYTHCFCIIVRYVYVRVKAVGHGYTHTFRGNWMQKLGFPQQAPSFQDLTVQTTLRSLTAILWGFFAQLFLVFFGQKHLSTTNYSHPGKKVCIRKPYLPSSTYIFNLLPVALKITIQTIRKIRSQVIETIIVTL